MSDLNKQQLDDLLPYGLLTTMKWLLSNGVNRHTVDNALKSKKLTSLSPGVYIRTGLPACWQSIVCSLQLMEPSPPIIGGLSALSLQGYSHYLSNYKTDIHHLYSESRLPNWLLKLNNISSFKWHSTKKIWQKEVLTNPQYIREFEWREGLPSLKLSCPEKAYLELLADVPSRVSFDHAHEILQGMTSLSPKKLTELLMTCRSIKIKRLFLWLAEKQDYVWYKYLNCDEIDLGTGKRMIALNGKFDSKYQITVPKHLYGHK